MPWIAGLLAGIGSCLPSTAMAELPPYVYLEEANEAPEAIRMRVLSVRRSFGFTSTGIRVAAEVVAVRRSASGLKPGSKLQVVYDIPRHFESWVGPVDPPLLTRGKTVPAFLAMNPGKPITYGLAASGESFEEWVWQESRGAGVPGVKLGWERGECGDKPAGKLDRPRMEWLGSDRARVRVWQMLPRRIEVVHPARLAVDGKRLQLMFDALDPGEDFEPADRCLAPFHLRFDIRDLPAGNYQVSVRRLPGKTHHRAE
jgi:hypothetical protein